MTILFKKEMIILLILIRNVSLIKHIICLFCLDTVKHEESKQDRNPHIINQDLGSDQQA